MSDEAADDDRPAANFTKDSIKVFISYSRKDRHFAGQLAAALRFAGMTPIRDLDDISAGEDWERRLRQLILEADSVVFVLSKASAKSKVCRFELIESEKNNKLIIPVVCQQLGWARVPPELAARNYIYFYEEASSPSSGFGVGLEQLVSALKTDMPWLREHSRLQQAAVKWKAKNNSDILLRGEELFHAIEWAKDYRTGAPKPTDQQMAFIRASQDHERKWQDERREMLAKAEQLEQFRQTMLMSLRAESMPRALRRICNQAVEVTFALAKSVDCEQYKQLEVRFWDLYWGEMIFVELFQRTLSKTGDESRIEASMVRFGHELQVANSAGNKIPDNSLLEYALTIQHECDKYLNELTA